MKSNMTENKEMQKRIQFHLLDLLEERMLISSAELHAAKALVGEGAFQLGVSLRKGAERGKSRNL